MTPYLSQNSIEVDISTLHEERCPRGWAGGVRGWVSEGGRAMQEVMVERFDVEHADCSVGIVSSHRRSRNMTHGAGSFLVFVSMTTISGVFDFWLFLPPLFGVSSPRCRLQERKPQYPADS